MWGRSTTSAPARRSAGPRRRCSACGWRGPGSGPCCPSWTRPADGLGRGRRDSAQGRRGAHLPADRQRADSHRRARRGSAGPEPGGGGTRQASRADGRDLRSYDPSRLEQALPSASWKAGHHRPRSGSLASRRPDLPHSSHEPQKISPKRASKHVKSKRETKIPTVPHNFVATSEAFQTHPTENQTRIKQARENIRKLKRWSGAGSNRRPSAFQFNSAKRCADLQKRWSLTSETALGGRCKIYATRPDMPRPPDSTARP